MYKALDSDFIMYSKGHQCLTVIFSCLTMERVCTRHTYVSCMHELAVYTTESERKKVREKADIFVVVSFLTSNCRFGNSFRILLA